MTKLLKPRGTNNIQQLEANLQNKGEAYWQRRGREATFRQFHQMVERVPAYKAFLQRQKFSPNGVRYPSDITKIPSVDKDNYLRVFPKKDLCWDGNLEQGQHVISTTSGSTGRPYYFPREKLQDWQYALYAELYMRGNFDITHKSTLYIVGFPMGAWIGGVFTYEALRMVGANNNYNLSIITPGIHKQEILNAIKQLGGEYDQIIIGAYAPFLKDILDDGIDQDINWKELNVSFVFSAEAFTEQFRDYVIKTTKPQNEFTFSLNHYGTVDQGTHAHETPESIFIRRSLVEKNSLTTLFPESIKQPTFCQYNPLLFYFEEVNNSLYCSSYSGLPLVRYDLKDYGGIVSRKTVHQKMTELGIDVTAEAKKNNFEHTLWDLPFLYIYERNDFSVSYYSFLLYPDTVRRALLKPDLLKFVTSKFTMLVEYNKAGRQELKIHIELKKSVDKSKELTVKLEQAIHDSLVTESSEYREVFKMLGDVARPHIVLWEYEDNNYFKPGAKQKWVMKT